MSDTRPYARCKHGMVKSVRHCDLCELDELKTKLAEAAVRIKTLEFCEQRVEKINALIMAGDGPGALLSILLESHDDFSFWNAIDAAKD